MTEIEALIAEARDAFKPTNASASLIRRLADALEDVYRASLTGQAEHARWQERAEKAEAGRDEFRNAWNAYGFEVNRLEDERDAALREMHARELHHFEEEKLRAEAEAERDRYLSALEDIGETADRAKKFSRGAVSAYWLIEYINKVLDEGETK